MNAIPFDTHEAIKCLTEADQLVTRSYLDLRSSELKNEIIVKIGGMIVAAVAVLLAFDKLL